jgi:hypothetical protein
MTALQNDHERAPTATGDELGVLLHHHAPDVLLALLDNPALEEPQLCLLLGRKDLPTEVLLEVAGRKAMHKSYRVKRALAFHPRTPRLALALVRHPHTTLSTVLGYLPELTVTALRDLAEPGVLPESLRKYLLAEIHRRTSSAQQQV